MRDESAYSQMAAGAVGLGMTVYCARVCLGVGHLMGGKLTRIVSGLSEVMLQQTTVAAVNEYSNRFTTRWPNVEALAARMIAGCHGRVGGAGYLRPRAQPALKCARAVAAQGWLFNDAARRLQELPGHLRPIPLLRLRRIAF